MLQKTDLHSLAIFGGTWRPYGFLPPWQADFFCIFLRMICREKAKAAYIFLVHGQYRTIIVMVDNLM